MLDVSDIILWGSNIKFDTLINFGVHRKKMTSYNIYHHNSQENILGRMHQTLGVQIFMAHDFFMASRAYSCQRVNVHVKYY